jgi:hypothetical protein
VFVFIVSSIFHMCIPLHKGDYGKISNEDEVRATLRAQGLSPGLYMFPCAGSMKEMGTPEHIEKMKEGPVAHMTVLPNGPYNMGKSLGFWLGYCLIIGVFTAYLTGLASAAGTDTMEIFRYAGTVAILGHAVTHVPDSIWKGVPWKITGKFAFEGVVYGLVTAGTFAWLWPAAA